MNKLIFTVLLLFQMTSYANEVMDYNGQKLVLINIETAERLDSAIQSHYQGISKLTQIKSILEMELLTVPGTPNYCETAIHFYGSNSTSSQNFFAKCKKALTNRDLIEELAQGVAEYENAQGLREIVSAYLSLLILM